MTPRNKPFGRRAALAGVLFTLCLLVAACGSSKSAAPTTSAAGTTTTAPATTTVATITAQPPNALQGEAKAAATGDIPDNQVYVVSNNTRAGYSIKYPEGWAQKGSGNNVTFYDKNNLVRIVVQPGGAPTLAQVSPELKVLKASTRSFRFQPPQRVQINGRAAIKVVYTTESAPNPVTNKRVQLTVDRYYLAQGGKRAIVDLGSPVGVDNVDGYRLMIQSFRWK
jgi:asparagine N-glycosylation enzyme membrane subunit Stt3